MQPTFMPEDLPLILVADDDDDIRSIVSGHLRSMNCRVIEAQDGDAAVAAARKEQPDLVIVDVMMPGKSGWEVCKDLRSDDATKDIGIIVLTGIGEQLNAMTSPLYGADANIDKPFEFAEFDFKVRKVLSDRRREKKLLDAKSGKPKGKSKNV